MLRNVMLGAVAAGATVSAVAPAAAQYGRWNDRGWRTVAYTRVDGRGRDTITVRATIRERAIRVCALRQPLHLRDFDIRFRNGQRQDVTTRAILQAGTCT